MPSISRGSILHQDAEYDDAEEECQEKSPTNLSGSIEEKVPIALSTFQVTNHDFCHVVLHLNSVLLFGH
jgi:hypothetical protein